MRWIIILTLDVKKLPKILPFKIIPLLSSG